MNEGEPIPETGRESSQSGELGQIVQELVPALGPVEGEVTALDGGITNRNFRARFAGTDYVIRIPGKDTNLLEIDRGAEVIANERAAGIGVGAAGCRGAGRAAGDRHRVRRGRGDGAGRPARARDPRRGGAGPALDPRPRRAPADDLRLVPDRRDLRRDSAAARGHGPGCLRARGRAGGEDRGCAVRARARSCPLPQRPARRELHPRAGAHLGRRLGVRRHGRPLLRPRRTSPSTTSSARRARWRCSRPTSPSSPARGGCRR